MASDDDRISALPDEILQLMLSHLTTEEATRTSVLSNPWLTLWMHTPRLDFNPAVPCPFDKKRGSEFEKAEVIKKETSKFVTRVNRMIQLHKSPVLDEFRIRFDLDTDFLNMI